MESSSGGKALTENEPINQKARLALMASGFALILGIAGNLLFRVGSLGINALLAALLLTVAFHLLIRRFQLPLRGAAICLSATVPVLAAVLVWRASLPLTALSVLGVLLALISTALIAHDRAFGERQSQKRLFPERGTWDLVAESVATGFHAVFGIFRLGVATRDGLVNWSPWNSRTGSIVRGILLAIPPLFIFGALFAGADAAFAQLLNNLVSVDLNNIGNHVFITGVFTWLASGWLYWVVLDDGSQLPRSESLGIGIAALEVSVVLALVMALFVAFIAVQFTYLFGGEALIQATTGLSYAEYARKGFFQLVAVAFLLLPMLLVGLWLVRAESPGNQRTVRLMAIGLEVLIILIMASALYRMRLYQEAYGLTYLRFLTTAFIIWLAVVFALFSATVLRGAPRWFISGAIGSALVAVILLAIVNPDARIVEANVQRAQTGLQFDDSYLRELSSDAVPAILAALATFPEPARCVTAYWLLMSWGSFNAQMDGQIDGTADSISDWRAWNFSDSKARRLVRESEDRLRVQACPPGADEPRQGF